MTEEVSYLDASKPPPWLPPEKGLTSKTSFLQSHCVYELHAGARLNCGGVASAVQDQSRRRRPRAHQKAHLHLLLLRRLPGSTDRPGHGSAKTEADALHARDQAEAEEEELAPAYLVNTPLLNETHFYNVVGVEAIN